MILALLFSFVFPDVPVSTPSFMPAAGWQRDLAIASNGESYFAAWSDGRMDGAVFATRISSDGRPLDPAGICIRGHDTGFSNPHVAWTGRNWLVINEAWHVSGAWVTTIDPDGHIAGPRPLIEYPSLGRQPVASNGSTTVVVNGGLSGLEIVVLDDAGRTIASYTALPNNPSFSRLSTWIVSNGSGFFVGWLAAGGTRFAIEGVRLDANGNLIDSNPIKVFTSTTYLDFPRIYSDGRDYLVVSGKHLRRIGSDGTLGDEVQQPVSAFLIWRGDHYAMFSGDALQYEVRALDRNGNSLGGLRFFDPKIDRRITETAAASNGDHLVLAWIQDNGHASDVAAMSIDLSADLRTDAASPPSILSFSATPQSARAIAAGNDGFAIGWEEQWSDDPWFDSYVARVDALGNPISVKRLLHLESVSTRGPRIAWNGSSYDVAFLAGDVIFTSGIDGEETHAIAAQHADDIDLASNGNVTLLVWSEAGTGFIKGLRLRNGLPLDAVPLTISDVPFLRHPRVAWNGEAFVVVWESGNEIRAVRVTPELIPLEIAPIIVTGFGSSASSPEIASSGSDVLIAYSRVGFIEARLMTKDSTLSVPMRTDKSSGRIEDQPSVSWDDGSYLLNWREYDLREAHDVYGARVSRSGKLLPRTLLRGGAQNPLTATASGRTLLLYDRLASEAPYGGVFRSFLQLLAPPRPRTTRR